MRLETVILHCCSGIWVNLRAENHFTRSTIVEKSILLSISEIQLVLEDEEGKNLAKFPSTNLYILEQIGENRFLECFDRIPIHEC